MLTCFPKISTLPVLRDPSPFFPLSLSGLCSPRLRWPPPTPPPSFRSQLLPTSKTDLLLSVSSHMFVPSASSELMQQLENKSIQSSSSSTSSRHVRRGATPTARGGFSLLRCSSLRRRSTPGWTQTPGRGRWRRPRTRRERGRSDMFVVKVNIDSAHTPGQTYD